MTVLSFPAATTPARRPFVAVHDVVGKDVATARIEFESLGLRVQVQTVLGVGAADKVFSQRPAAGSTLPSNGLVTLQVLTQPPSQIPTEIIEALEQITNDVQAVKGETANIPQLQTDVAAVQTEVTAVKTDVAAARTDVAAVQTDTTAIKDDTATIRDAVVKQTRASQAQKRP